MNSDFVLSDHGSLFILVPLSEGAHDWVDDNLGDDALWYGRGIAIEPRYVGEILQAITDEDLTIEANCPNCGGDGCSHRGPSALPYEATETCCHVCKGAGVGQIRVELKE